VLFVGKTENLKLRFAGHNAASRVPRNDPFSDPSTNQNVRRNGESPTQRLDMIRGESPLALENPVCDRTIHAED
jgi:hypothetical protein